MRLHARLTGEGVEDYEIIKNINVQQNPGRGAKVVCPRPKHVPYQQSRVMNIDGNMNQRVIHMQTQFTLGEVIISL